MSDSAPSAVFDVLFASPEISQHKRLVQIESAFPSCTLVVARGTWSECVSGHFANRSADAPPGLSCLDAQIDCISTNAHLKLTEVLGEQVSLRLLCADGRYRPFHGYVVGANQLGSDGGRSLYRLRLADFSHFLQQRTDTRVFLQVKADEIISRVLSAYPQANFRFELSPQAQSAAPMRGLTTQAGETDAAFVVRLLCQEGWNWRLEHADDGEPLSSAKAAKHCLVISDSDAQPHDLGELRYGRPDVRRNGLAEDTITQISFGRSVQPNAVTLGAWHPGQLAGVTAQSESSLNAGNLPAMEVYSGSGERLYAQHDPGLNHGDDQPLALVADQRALLALRRHELAIKTIHAQSAVRTAQPGSEFALTEHDRFGTTGAASGRTDNRLRFLSVTHEAANNLGAQAAELLKSTDIDAGSYRNTWTAIPAAATLVPPTAVKPVFWGLQTAVVVGHPNEPVSTERDLRVRIQFPWQRGRMPLSGGLSGPATPAQGDSGHATADMATSLWVRLAQPIAGSNWGHIGVPRVGTEVLVSYVDGDVDRPVIVGQLHNGEDAQPWPAGVNSGANHPGTLSGYHAPSLDRAGLNQWVIDDATSQLRMRVASVSPASPWSELTLGHVVNQGVHAGGAGSQRGAWLGSGFYAHTQGWASVRADGLYVSTTARPASYGSAQSAHMDAAEAITLIRGAQQLGQRLNEAAGPQGAVLVHSHQAEDAQAVQTLLKAIDPALDGKYTGAVGGQDAKKAEGRTLAQPTERFDTPHMLLDTPNSAAFTSPAAIVGFSNADTSLTAQGDVHATAQFTAALASGETTSLYNHEGELQAFAANGNVSLRAHTDQLELLAEKDIVITSVNNEITIAAKDRVEMVGGDAKIVLAGGNIEYHTSAWTVQAAAHEWAGGGSAPAALSNLPDSRVKMFDQQIRAMNSITGEPIPDLPYKLTTASGDVYYGVTDEDGKVMRVATSAPEKIQVEWGATRPSARA